MARASAFDWGQLDRQTLFDIMYLIRERLVGQSIPVQKFHDQVIRHVKTYLPIMASKELDVKVEKTWVYVGGFYYSDKDKDRNKSIGLCLAYNPLDKNIKMTPRKFSRFCMGFADTILHEIVHMRQFRKRKFKHLPDYSSTASRTKQREEQEYLGHNDEIDAYAFNIACELDEKFGSNQKQIVSYLNENQKGLRRRHNSYRMYLKAFGHDHNHPVIQRIKKRVIYYLPKAIVGRPFRPSEWIGRY
jgi:hypothetical protein